MASAVPKLELRGDKELIRKLQRLGKKRTYSKIMRAAANAAATPIVKGVRSEWPEDSGLSKRSVTKKVIKTRSGYSAIVGIDKAARDAAHVPSNIDHLVELGYQHVGGRTVPARAPLRRGFDKSAKAAEARFAEKAKEGIEKEAAKR